MDKQDRGGLALAKAVEAAYAQGQTDYYLEPMVRVDENGKPVGKIKLPNLSWHVENLTE